jgi:hypothetical protein
MVPDANTIWTFRDGLKRADAVDILFRRFDEALRASGFLTMSGQIIDDTIVVVPQAALILADSRAQGVPFLVAAKRPVLHWADWQDGRGVLLSGDILQVVPSKHVIFMWSFPNLIPLSATGVQRLASILEPFAFDAVYGAFSSRGQIEANGKELVAASVARYIARISDAFAVHRLSE